MTLTIILGPTASGKTALAIRLAQQHGCAVISADSRQVYAGFNIGTAKPPAAWRDTPHAATEPDYVDSVPHYLLNIASPNQHYTLANWQHDSYSVIASLLPPSQHPKGSGTLSSGFLTPYKLPANSHQLFLVGGTMLYLDSVLYNYDLPAVPPNESLRQELETKTADVLYQRLVEHDPASRAFVEPQNKRRIIRALEVIAATGKPFSAQRQKRQPKYNYRIIGLFPGWDTLQKNITQRAQQMIADGLIEETRQLQRKLIPPPDKGNKGGFGNTSLLQTMNYKQAALVLAGQLTAEGAIADMVRVNMRYAHRQMSWWKNNKNIQWFDPQDIKNIKKVVEKN